MKSWGVIHFGRVILDETSLRKQHVSHNLTCERDKALKKVWKGKEPSITSPGHERSAHPEAPNPVAWGQWAWGRHSKGGQVLEGWSEWTSQWRCLFSLFQSFFSAVSWNPWGAFWPENERVLMKTTTWAALSDGENMEPSPEVVKSPSWTRLVTVEVMRKRWILDLFWRWCHRDWWQNG